MRTVVGLREMRRRNCEGEARGGAVTFSTIGVDTPTGEDVNGNVEVMSMELAKMMVEWCLIGGVHSLRVVSSCSILLIASRECKGFSF
jgi:hypothetical protein